MRRLVQHEQVKALTLSKGLVFLRMDRDNSGSPGPLHISFKQLIYSNNKWKPKLCPIQFPVAPLSDGIPFVSVCQRPVEDAEAEMSQAQSRDEQNLGESGSLRFVIYQKITLPKPWAPDSLNKNEKVSLFSSIAWISIRDVIFYLKVQTPWHI